MQPSDLLQMMKQRDSVLRLEFSPEGDPETAKVKVEPGKLVPPLTIGTELFGTVKVDRKKSCSQSEIDVPQNAARVLSLGLRSRFIQVPRR